MPTLQDLQYFQAMPLSMKVDLTRNRIRDWVREYGEDGCYISFSGGKDSTVLLDIVRNVCGYKRIPAVFVDVPTQFPELREFVKTFDNVEIIKPKISFVEVCEKYGFPLISKEVSECVEGARKYLTSVMSEIESTKREERKCIYCDNLLGKKGCLGMCNKHYIQYKRWGDPLHADNKERATIDGYYRDGKTGRREHRVIYENYYGISLLDEEIIHHINFIKTDNRIENLYKYPNASEHIKAHRNFERLQETLQNNEEIYFENGQYLKREREREHLDRHPYAPNFADIMGIPRRRGVNEKQLQNLKQGIFPNIDTDKLAELINSSNKKGEKVRLAMLLGMLTKDNKIKGNSEMSDDEKSDFSKEKYKFFLDAPFEISNKCCTVMKKEPAHRYMKETGRVPMTAQMASESRLRTQKRLQNGCNAFDCKNPISNPMSFWTEQDILLYIKLHNLPICSVYGDVVVDYDKADIIEGQMDISDFLDDGKELFDKDNLPLKTTGCSRTGCCLCAFGANCEKREDGRFLLLKQTHPKIYDLLDICKNNGVTYRDAIEWTNKHLPKNRQIWL